VIRNGKRIISIYMYVRNPHNYINLYYIHCNSLLNYNYSFYKIRNVANGTKKYHTNIMFVYDNNKRDRNWDFLIFLRRQFNDFPTK